MIGIEARLSELKVLGLDRRTRLVSGPQGPHVLVDGRPALLLCSDNCLGLADHPRVRNAAAEAAMRWGVGTGGSRLGSGTMTVQRRLEDRLAAFVGRERALLFGSGYLVNTGTIAALARSGDVVFSDELNHASIVDGCRLSRADVFVYDHRDVEHLRWGIARSEDRGALIVTESVFSIDGDLAPLEEIVELAQRCELRTVVDDTHGMGALGPDGRGALARAGLADQVDVVVGSLGAALGCYGGFATCDELMSRYLNNAARPLSFSTAPAPPTVAGGLAALELLQERPRLVEKLAANAAALRGELSRQGFTTEDSDTHIVSLAIGDPGIATRICEVALTEGVFAEPIRPPTVPPMTSRVRLTVMATHREDELRDAARVLAAAARTVGFEPEGARDGIAVPIAIPAPVPLADGREPAVAAPAGVFDVDATEPVRRAA